MQSASLPEPCIREEGNVCTVHTNTNSMALPALKSTSEVMEADYYNVSINTLKQCNSHCLNNINEIGS